MSEVRYQLLFEGKASPEDEMGTVMRVEARAPLDTRIDPIFSEGAPQAILTATVEPDEYGGFRESGEIVFGGGTLRYSTEGEGRLGDSPDPTLQQGGVIFHIEGGTGAFEGASGNIASVFTVSENAEVRDSQSAVIFLAD
jgi:hypothetical protein